MAQNLAQCWREVRKSVSKVSQKCLKNLIFNYAKSISMRYSVSEETRKGLSVKERENFAATLEKEKVYHVGELVQKAVDMYPNRDAESLKHTLGSDLVEKGLCVRIGHGRYMKNGKYPQKPLNPPKNPQVSPMLFQSSPPATILHLATDKELADELRRRGYEVEAKKITTI